MKTKYLFLILFIIGGCEDQAITDVVQFEKELLFRANNTYYSNDKQLKFTIREVNDSRCPRDIICIWQGEAVIKIVSELPGLDSVKLSTYDNPLDTIGNFTFELFDVSPYPETSKTIGQKDYKIRMRIHDISKSI
ncbi:MAG: hypothetical protein WCY58_00045 [Mariniphaga sp.]|nr:hypothetical protein [Mariniphaga sp.]MDD4225403.1 hypothetical protein [Mariniphaga sp.]MDD4424314.1 hypothetical protein [Mariniphaga sp.]